MIKNVGNYKAIAFKIDHFCNIVMFEGRNREIWNNLKQKDFQIHI